jgi:hypothetical protein
MRLVSSIMPGYPKDKNSKEGKIPNPRSLKFQKGKISNPKVEIPLANDGIWDLFFGIYDDSVEIAS